MSGIIEFTESVKSVKTTKIIRTYGLQSSIDPNGYLDDYKQVHISMFKEHREKLVNEMNRRGHMNGMIVVQGGKNLQIYDTDVESLFRQESSFAYLFAINEPDCYGAIDLESKQSILFIPKLNPSYSVWAGKIKSTDFYKEKYGVDEVYFTDEISKILHSKLECKHLHQIYVSSGVNKISGNSVYQTSFADIDSFEINDSSLYSAICQCRVIKTTKELNLLKFIAKISSEAHVHVMKEAKYCKKENELESLFLYYINRYYGCRYVSYTCVCGSGHNSAILHYGHAGAPNDRVIEHTDMLLLDMGAEYWSYDSDITCSFPVAGKFSDSQKIIYDIVLNTQKAIEREIKAGVTWNYLQSICETKIVEGLISAGLILPCNKNLEELVNLQIAKLFMPHFFGHLLGLDTHDVNSLEPSYPDNLDNELRTVKNSLLVENMVITNEPGVYFVSSLLEPAFDGPLSMYLNKSEINKYINFGGVRLEDDIIVKTNGCENMTHVPRSINDIEKLMNIESPQLCEKCMLKSIRYTIKSYEE